MLFDLFLKIWVTPENIMELILEILMIISMCFIFTTWKEKWWKSLIPIYGTYIIFKNTWKKKKWLFVVPIIFNMISTKCMSFIKKHMVINLLDTVETYIETERIMIDIDVTQLVICVVLFLISVLICYVLTRITYLKICNSLCIKSMVLRIGTFLFPQIFLLIDYIYYKNVSPNHIVLD